MCLRSETPQNASSSLPAPKDNPSKQHPKTKKYLKTIKSVKKRARSELKHKWRIHDYASKPQLSPPPLGALAPSPLPVLDGATLSFPEFSHHVEKNHLPCLIRNLIRHWPATKTWTSSRALKAIIPKSLGCKVGSDDDGYAVRLPYKQFHRYLHDPSHGLVDDSPLYIFDSTLLKKCPALASAYFTPHLFSEDLLKYAGEARRPPYQWICVGGARSGTGIHVDPLHTSAWNALVTGHKRWALFPPGSVPKAALKPRGVDSAVRWFDVVYPETQTDAWLAKGYPRPVEVWQEAGETVFVPCGWWHVVLNLDFTVAVTHNFCSSSNFAQVFRHARVSRPKMAVRWLEGLREARPDLYEVGRGIVARGERCSDATSPSSSSSSSSSDDE